MNDIPDAEDLPPGVGLHDQPLGRLISYAAMSQAFCGCFAYGDEFALIRLAFRFEDVETGGFVQVSACRRSTRHLQSCEKERAKGVRMFRDQAED